MRFAGRESWTVEYGTSPSVIAALFVRDTLALSVDTSPELPGLDPSVPVMVPQGVDRAAATREWPGWWEEVLAIAGASHQEAGEPSESDALLTRPALRDAVVALRSEIGRFGAPAGMPSALPVGDVVRGVESRIGRHVRPFRLVITEVPVQGLVWERVTPAHVLASVRYLHDPARSAPALRSVVEDLA